jgi:hypothetical protein
MQVSDSAEPWSAIDDRRCHAADVRRQAQSRLGPDTEQATLAETADRPD